MNKKFFLILLLTSACSSYKDRKRTVLTKEKERLEKLISTSAYEAKKDLINIIPDLKNYLDDLIENFFIQTSRPISKCKRVF